MAGVATIGAGYYAYHKHEQKEEKVIHLYLSRVPFVRLTLIRVHRKRRMFGPSRAGWLMLKLEPNFIISTGPEPL